MALNFEYKHNFEGKTWVDNEVKASKFKDERIAKRFKSLLGQMWIGVGESIPFACQDWANTKAAYRFFSNERISEKEILDGHFQATKNRFSKTKGLVLILQDTTEFSYQRENPELIGATRILENGNPAYGNLRRHTICGLLMHSSLAVTTSGLPLGLTASKFWTRKKFKGCTALKRHINPTRVPIDQKESVCWLENMKQSIELLNDPARCVHVGDRGSDIFELFCLANELKTHFLIRTCVDRLAGDGDHTIINEMDEVRVKGLHRVEVIDKKGNISEALLEIKYKRIKVLPPIGKQRKYPGLQLTVIHAIEKNKPKNREKIIWKLITDMPAASRRDAIEKLNWYAMRWKIETFHKILKSGCKAEESKLRTAEGLVKLLSVFCILSWRIFWMTMLNRLEPNISPTLAFTKSEIHLLNYLKKGKGCSSRNKNLSEYLLKVAVVFAKLCQ